MRNPDIRARLTMVAMAAVIGGAAIFALPRGDTQQSPAAPEDSPPAVDAGRNVRPPSEERLIDRPDADPEPGRGGSPGLADAPHAAPVDAGAMQQAADVASQFAVEFMSWRYDEPPAEREARLTPLLTDHGQRWLAGGSSAMAELEDQRRRREVTTAELAFLEPIEVNANTIGLLAVLHVTVANPAGAETIEHSLTLRMQREIDGRWAVDEMTG